MTTIIKLLLVFIVLYPFLNTAPLLADWQADGIAICTEYGERHRPRIIPDGAGGSILAWSDGRNGDLDIFIQRIDMEGTPLCAANGIVLCCETGEQDNPVIVQSGSAFIAAWEDRRSGGCDIYAQAFDANGGILWSAGGVIVCGAAGEQFHPAITADDDGGALIAWVDERDTRRDIYAQRLSGPGIAQWPLDGVAVNVSPSDKEDPVVVADSLGGAIILWRCGSIFAQRISTEGSLLWPLEGTAICSSNSYQSAVQAVPDGSGGVIAAWEDSRNCQEPLYPCGNSDIYAQRLDAGGGTLWDEAGVAACGDPHDQLTPALIGDGSGGAVIVWEDHRAGADIYAQRIDTAGTVVWDSDGSEVCTVFGGQESPAIVNDGAGGAVIVWYDSRNGYPDYNIYAQRMSGAGVRMWSYGGAAVCTAPDGQYFPCLVYTGSGGTVVSWIDGRDGGEYIYAQHINSSGGTVDVLLQGYGARPADGGITVHWRLSSHIDDSGFHVKRSICPGRHFEDLIEPLIIKNGLSYSLHDRSVSPGESYVYRVETTDASGTELLFETAPVSTPHIPLTLHQNFPNPFNPSTEIRYYLPFGSNVELDVFDISGRLVIRLTDGFKEKGAHGIEWDGADGSGRTVQSGVYIYRLRAGKTTMSRKMMLLN